MDKQIFVGSEPKPNKIEPIQNHVINKPHGGLWTSTMNGMTSRWIEWCKENEFFKHDLSVRYALKVSEEAKIYHIYGYNDLEFLYDHFKLDEDSKVLHELDFEKLSNFYDAVHLTDEGMIQCHLSRPYHLYGWDCESTIWFRWCFDSVEKVEGIKNDSIT